MAALREGGLSVSEAAARFELSQRTIFRILKRSGDEAT
ncbi:MAG: helix-turn-helix domain-containing protein [Dehalococcoidia bacterium]|nr:helix-turn-helix domain-containing protein [Dehalococcoidia bacterium]